MPTEGPVEAVTFDFWNTLVAEGRGADNRTAHWRESLEAEGLVVPQEVMERAMTDLWSWFEGRWEGNDVVTPSEAVDQALRFMGVDASQAVRDAMAQTLHDGHDPAEMRTADGIGDTLERLKSAGVRVGIICDVGLTPSARLRTYLEHHGLLGHFDGWSFSDEVGCYKPDGRIFAHAAETLGHPDPTRTAHVGDLRRTDIAGARNAGWRAVRYAGFYDDQSDLPDGHAVVAHHRDLPAALGH